MSNSFARMLKIAEMLYDVGDSEGFERLCVQLNAYFKKCAHFEPLNDGITPNPWRHNMDYAEWENSPYYGSMTEFMEKFPGGIPDWIKWRRETQKQRNLMWSKISARRDNTRIKIAADKIALVLKAWSKRLKDIARAGAVAYINEMETSAKKWSIQVNKWRYIKNDLEPFLKILDRYIDEEIESNNLSAVVISLYKFRNTPKYKRYSDLFFNMISQITDSASERFFNYLNDMETKFMQVAEDEPLWPDPKLFPDDPEGMFEPTPFEPTEEEIEESQKPTVEEERAQARQLIEKVLELVTKEEAEMLLKESAPKKIVEAKFVPVGPDDTKKFPKEPHLWSDEGLKKFKSVTDFLKKYRKRDQKADDLGSAALKAIQDFIDYWKLLQKGKERRTKAKKRKGK